MQSPGNVLKFEDSDSVGTIITETERIKSQGAVLNLSKTQFSSVSRFLGLGNLMIVRKL